MRQRCWMVVAALASFSGSTGVCCEAAGVGAGDEGACVGDCLDGDCGRVADCEAGGVVVG